MTLYASGEAVAVSYSNSTTNRSVYLGKVIMGSVRTTSTATGVIDDRFDYTAGPARAPSILPIGARPEGTHDVFGQPFQGDLDGLMNLGYMSKPYESVTGLYNYGFRDYRPQQARFTTPDPIRDGNNWFAYVNNDPVNYVDWWGLEGWYISTPYLGSSGVSGASDKHYGNDWVYRDAAGNNITEGQRVDSETAGTVRIGNDPILGNFVRVTNDDNLRTDYFHFKSKTVTNNSTVQVGVQIGIAGNTGLSSGAHVHVAQSYPLNQVPDGIDYVNPPNIHRSYIEPPSTPPGPGNVPKAPQVYPDFDLLPVETPIKYIQNKGINMCTI